MMLLKKIRFARRKFAPYSEKIGEEREAEGLLLELLQEGLPQRTNRSTAYEGEKQIPNSNKRAFRDLFTPASHMFRRVCVC